jgi:hypothetical protein
MILRRNGDYFVIKRNFGNPVSKTLDEKRLKNFNKKYNEIMNGKNTCDLGSLYCIC